MLNQILLPITIGFKGDISTTQCSVAAVQDMSG